MATALQSGVWQVGDFEFGPNAQARCVVVIKTKSKGKVQKAQASGKDDAKTTWQGKEPADIEITLTWDERDDAADSAICDIIYQIGPRGANPGKSYKTAYRDARLHGVDALIIEEQEGPDRTPGTSLVTCKLKGSSVSPKAQTAGPGQGKATTDTDPMKWKGRVPDDPTKTTTVQGFGGDPQNKVTFPGNVPTVKP